MPYIDENHLVDLHKTIESKELQEEKLLNELQKQRVEKDTIYRSRNRFKWVSVCLLIILLTGIALYFVKPSFFVNERLLQTENKMLINKNEVISYKDEISLLEVQLNEYAKPVETGEKQEEKGGVIYAVQVAALENRDISLYSNELQNINQYKDKPYNKYSLGNFTSLEDAKSFRKEMVALGFQDAFVASYKNGKRIKIEEAF